MWWGGEADFVNIYKWTNRNAVPAPFLQEDLVISENGHILSDFIHHFQWMQEGGLAWAFVLPENLAHCSAA